MKKLLFPLFGLLLLAACTKRVTEPLPGIEALKGTWKSTDFPVAVTLDFNPADSTGKLTAVASNAHSFRVGDVFWKNAAGTGEKTYRLGQLTKSKSGYLVFVTGNAQLTSDTQLVVTYTGASDDAGLLKLDGKRATFTKQ